MGIATLLGLKPKEKELTENEKLARKLFPNASEEELQEKLSEIKGKFRDREQFVRDDEKKRTGEATFKIKEGPHMEAIIRGELIKRAKEVKRKLGLIAGDKIQLLKPEAKKISKKRKLEMNAKIKGAKEVANDLLEGLSKRHKSNILYVLQSLRQDYNVLSEDDLPIQISAFFINAETRLAQYNAKHKTEIAFNTVKGQLFQILQREIQPEAGIIKNGKRMANIKKAKKTPLREDPFENIDPLSFDPQKLLETEEDKEEALDPNEAGALIEEITKERRKNQKAA
jgi:hypothetical protein